MSEMILTICAEADQSVPPPCDEVSIPKSRSSPSIDELAVHSLPPRAVAPLESPSDTEESELDALEDERRRATYRGRTVWMLRRYMRYSMETGRLPSLLGREFFRAKVTRFTSITFEDRVIFVHDMETCLNRLDDFSRKVIGRVVLQEYSHEEAAHLLGCARRTLHRTLLESEKK